MPREITSHKVNGCNDRISIKVLDEPGSGGANHRYEIQGFDIDKNPSVGKKEGTALCTMILFQNGPISEVGTNGITQEVLLAIVADRLQSFQKGPYACRENALALTKIEEAIHWLKHRTMARVDRGVEGTHTI